MDNDQAQVALTWDVFGEEGVETLMETKHTVTRLKNVLEVLDIGDFYWLKDELDEGVFTPELIRDIEYLPNALASHENETASSSINVLWMNNKKVNTLLGGLEGKYELLDALDFEIVVKIAKLTGEQMAQFWSCHVALESWLHSAEDFDSLTEIIDDEFTYERCGR